MFAGWSAPHHLVLNTQKVEVQKKPNILFVIADDQSYPHASAYKTAGIKTPAFDRIAKEGILFNNAFSAAPSCSPSRAAILTGKNCWQLENAGTHDSSFPIQYKTYPDLLEHVGYSIGFTGKGWGPGNYKASGRLRNPAGIEYNRIKMTVPKGISPVDYAANFSAFFQAKPKDSPFCFWVGGNEPHRSYKKGIGSENGIKSSQIEVPGFLPNHTAIRDDMANYFYEIQWFDNHLKRIIEMLDKAGELDNTIIVVTSDNGMPFPRAKANVYEYSLHMPLAIRWGNKIKGNRVVDDLVSLTDIAPTFIEAAGINPGKTEFSGQSLLPIFLSSKQGLVTNNRQAVYASRERHSSSRWNNLGYPQRCIRTQNYLYIWNVKPERWPAGDPKVYDKNNQLPENDNAYFDIDEFNNSYIFNHRTEKPFDDYFQWAVSKRPEVELYDIKKDPSCLKNLAKNPNFAEIRKTLKEKLQTYLQKTNDPRMGENGEIFETYPRYSPIRNFPNPDKN